MVKKRKKRKILFGYGVFSFLEIFFSCYHIHIYHTACMAVPKIPINRSFFRTRQPTGNDPQPLTTSKGRNTTTNLQPPGKQPPPRINWPKVIFIHLERNTPAARGSDGQAGRLAAGGRGLQRAKRFCAEVKTQDRFIGTRQMVRSRASLRVYNNVGLRSMHIWYDT